MTNNYTQYRKGPDEKGVKSTDGRGNVYNYKPRNKRERSVRRQMIDRFRTMRDDYLRKEFLKDREYAQKDYRMWTPERDIDDYRANIALPDSLAIVQSYLQETINLQMRPMIEGVEYSDGDRASLSNIVLNHSMDRTDFDRTIMEGMNTKAIEGMAVYLEEWHLEVQTVKDLTSVSAEGELKYKEREIIRKDDSYTRLVSIDDCFIDPAAEFDYEAIDFFYREVLSHEEFMRIYGDKPGFKNQSKVIPAKHFMNEAGADQVNTSFFDVAEDIDRDEVEVLHYHNKEDDLYGALANSVVIRDDPLPTKHKELPFSLDTLIRIPGTMYGMGIPHIIRSTKEVRQGGLNMVVDRGTLHYSKMFLVNDLFDIDEEEATPRPNGFIHVNANGLPLNQAIQPLEYGDTPVSYYRLDDLMTQSERRATGIDENSQGVPQGGTATQAALLDEATQKRVGLYNQMSMISAIKRIGRLKYSNINFFYKQPRISRLVVDNEEKAKTDYRKIRVHDQEVQLVENKNSGGESTKSIKINPISGNSQFELNEAFSGFMEGDEDLVMTTTSGDTGSKAVKRSNFNEMMDRISANPLFVAHLDPQKTLKSYLKINDIDPRTMMRGDGMTDHEWANLADLENKMMAGSEDAKPVALAPTPDATEAHTLEHIRFTESEEFQNLPRAVQDSINAHILAEHAANPTTSGGEGLFQGPQGSSQTVAGGPATVSGNDVTQQLGQGGNGL